MSKKESYLGVDIGSASIKIVELTREKGMPRLLNYGYLEQEIDITRGENSDEKVRKLAFFIKAICEKSKMVSKNVVAAMPSFSVFSSVVSLPDMPKKDLASAVWWEAKKIIPMNIEDVVLDWKVLGGTSKEARQADLSDADKPEDLSQINPLEKKDKPGEKEIDKKNLKILITTAPKKLVQRYIEVFQLAKMNLLSLETESFALSRALVGRDPSVIMIIDLGTSTSDIIIVDQGVPSLSRSVKIGGINFTQAISQSLGISNEMAESFKRDLVSGKQALNELPDSLKEIMDSMVSEIKYSLELYQSQSLKPVEKIVLSGGSSFLPNFGGYISQAVGTRVYLGNPWARVIYPVDLKPVIEKIGPRFAVAVGLAMREIV
ncbi:MAG: pilus assembly protein PilM [Patescibacteria group bacterium]|nr:pilus assembly protein PilM [Patescibacteria group bacterium]